MSKKENIKDLAFLDKARKRIANGVTYWQENYQNAEDDLNFLNGDQWPESVRKEREEDGRPCLVNNVLPTYVDQIIGDQRQNKPAIKVSTVESVGVKVGEKKEELKIGSENGDTEYSLGEVLSGAIKNIEYNCDAETAYDMAFQAAVESGIGFLRVRTDYITDDSFDQDILIECIENQFSVLLDPQAKARDFSDGNWATISENVNKEVFESEYPDCDVSAIADLSDTTVSWAGDDFVKVTEYFTREQVTKTLLLMSDGSTYDEDKVKPVLDELAAEGITEKRRRKVKTHKVFWRKIVANELLAGPIEVPGTCIPVIPVFGKTVLIKDKFITRSAIRNSKDAQRMANYWDSAATESVALAPKAPFIGQEGHIEGFESIWSTANTKNHSILTYVPQFQGDSGPRRDQPAAVPSAELSMGLSSNDKIKGTMGMFDASLGAQGGETSGRAIIARQRQGDRGTFVFMDNLTKAIRQVGKICVDYILSTYDSERMIRLKFADESEDFVMLNKQIKDEQTGEWVTIHDLSIAKYDVVVKTGPAFSTQRIEAAEAMMQFAQAVPQAAAVMADLIAQNMDWPGADIIAERLRKVMPPNLLSKKEREEMAEEAKDEQPPQPTPEQMVEIEKAKSDAQISKDDLEKSALSLAEEKVKFQAAQLKAQESLKDINTQAEGGDQLAQTVRMLMAEAFAEMGINPAQI